MPQSYNNPNQVKSSIDQDEQIRIDYFERKALIDRAKESYFGQLGDTQSLPEHYGKKIKRYRYLNLLDDANINAQGLDAKGAVIENGNLYGSSKDFGTITGLFPTLTENGGRVNRVGVTRVEMEGVIAEYGLFEEYTQDSDTFDSDPNARAITRQKLIEAAAQVNEAQIQADLLTAATTVLLAGNATTVSELSPESSTPAVPTMALFNKLSQMLIDARVPKQTKLLTGENLTDTRTVSDGWFMYVGNELLPTIRAIADSFGQKAFIPVQQYAAGTTVARGEIGAIGDFRLITPPEMMRFAGAGAAVSAGANTGYYETNGKYDVFPLLVVGAESFSHISLIGSGKNNKKYKIQSVTPEQNIGTSDPYGKTGLTSISWWYGMLVKQPERLGLIKCVAKQA